MKAKKRGKFQKINFCAIFHLSILIFVSKFNKIEAVGSCDRTRQVFEGVNYGEITDGLNSNYTQDSHCEWLIKAENSSQFITLKFLSLKTECSYDYIFIYDGNSYSSSPLLGSFSGQTDPQDITATSGFMLILLYSDTNYNLDGFRATFSITNCLKNCSSNGLCVNHKCHCNSDYSGNDCSVKICKNCANEKLSSNESQWVWITQNYNSFTPRTAHIAIYDDVTDAVYTFGGYDLNNILGKLEIYQFNDSKWIDEDEKEISIGIKNDNDEFWFRDALLAHVNSKRNKSNLNLHENEKIQISSEKAQNNQRNLKSINYESQKFKPLPRYGHAACKFKDSFLIYGGKLYNGSLSNELWMFNISTKIWSLKAKNSSLIPPKLTRHTLTFVNFNNFIYLFGGSLSDGEFSSQMFRINLNDENEQWEEVKPRGGKSFDYRIVAHTTVYHKSTKSLIIYGGIIAGVARFSKLSDRMFSFNLMDNHWSEIFYPRKDSVPRERAFHTAVIYGDYMIIFGGYSHRHNKEEICYDNQMYLYNLMCHLWVNKEVLGDQKYGRKLDETRNIRYPKRQGVFAHTAMLRRNNQLLIHGGYHGNVNNDFLAFIIPNMTDCSVYKTSSECISNPACGYCSYDNICYYRTMSTCYTNLQTTRCHGICPTLRDCRSCLIHGNDNCKWCVQTGKCNNKSDRDACGEDEGYEQQGAEIENQLECAAKDRPPGLIYMKYLQPYDFNNPDYVGLINTTSVEFSTSTAPSIDSSNSGEVIARLHGYIKTEVKGENVKVCGSYADINLIFDNQNVMNFTADQNLCQPTKITSHKTLIDLQARRHKPQVHIHSKIGIQRNSSKSFTAEFLEPFSFGDCGNYQNCRYCLSDSSCGWCDITRTCMSREINETNLCRDQESNYWRYLVTNSDQCINCSNFISCQSCAAETSCEWWNEDTKCERRGRSLNGVKEVNECASPCYQRNSCENCLNDKGKCVWCQETQQCFSFSIYTSEFQFGLCREWIDQLIVNGAESYGHHQCKSCGMFKNCSTCLRSLNCGWCYIEENPIEGTCVDGDFSGTSTQCSVALNTTEVVKYTYAECPDLDECMLDIHDCHPNAECHNIPGSYICQCRKGFLGDGKKKCDKTCDETCIHGRCSNFPDYKCICDLGWTGSDCSVNCNCNNHSTCENGIGICDECQDYTEGQYCEKCKSGSFGNATQTGCQPCECNGHADKSAGVCDQKTGKCFCIDNTEGENCEFCSNDFYGDPKSNGRCYLQCQPRGMLKEVKVQGIGSFKGQKEISECLWLLKLNSSIANGSLIQFEIEEMKIDCHSNAIFIYNSISEFSENFGHKKLVNAVCGSSSIISESKTGEMAIYFQKTARSENFNALVHIRSCQLGTCDFPFICNGTRCTCPINRRGAKCEIEICKGNCTNGYCDKSTNHCVCNEGFTGDDCSLQVKSNSIYMRELFSTQTVDRNMHHLRKTLPRFGNSVNADRRGFLWIFGGFSLTNGALNDIRQFDTKNHTWVQVTVDGTASKMPLGRFFHASEIKAQSIYIHGGLSNDFEVLSDFWEFNIHEQRWIEVENDKNPGHLAGHTMNLVKDGDNEILIIIGGYRKENYGNLDKQHGNDIEILHSDESNENDESEENFDEKLKRKIEENENFSKTMKNGRFLRQIEKYENSSVKFHEDLTGKFYEDSVDKIQNVRENSNDKIYEDSRKFNKIEDLKDKFKNLRKYRSIKASKNPIIYQFNFEKKSWSNLEVFGNPPSMMFGHTTSYHIQSQVLYIFGGYQVINGKLQISKKLYTLRKLNETWSWNSLPIFNELNRPEENLPRARFLHSSISFQNFLAIHGGENFPFNSSDFLNAYVYKCNSYIRLTDGIEIFGNLPNFAHSQAVAVDNDDFYIVGGISTHFSIHIVTIPTDICQLFSLSKHACRSNRGCSFATTTTNSVRSTECFSSDQKETKKSELTSTAFNWGSMCDEGLLSTRNCTSFTTCDDCATIFPYESASTCKWSSNKKCYVEKRPKNETEIQKCEAGNFNNFTIGNCMTFNDCKECLADENNSTCVWSSKINRCIDDSMTPLLCAGAICGANLVKNSECPVKCESLSMCSQCLSNSDCGWCASEGNGEGKCMQGNVNHSYEKCNNTWHYLTCPAEDECQNNHHNCDAISEKCEDLENGFRCVCAEGFKIEGQKCTPICNQGCVFGTCIHPDKCQCDFGYVGSNCSIACNCSGHSDCEGPDKLDVCLKCMNNTRGDQCEKCERFYVQRNGKCESCNSFCHGHSDVCVGSDLRDFNGTVDELREIIVEGPTADDAVCLGCGNFTTERRCDSCIGGYFRGTTNLNDACRVCMCNGHGDTCDPVTGEKCNCGNNTESDHTCPAASSKSDKNSIQVFHCYNSQCAKCRESYSGHPKNGHQCYKHITIESRMCINEAKAFDECEHSLDPGKMQFFVIQPRFMNVDIRIIIDVTEGEIDLQMINNDDSFVVFTNQSTGDHEILLDSKYQWIQDDGDGISENLNITPLVTSSKRTFDNAGQQQSTSSQVFRVVDKVAGDALATHITLRQANMLLRVFGMKNRLVITLPQNIHNLSGTRFFVAIRAVAHAKMTSGIVYFRQDQLHIDLFVFFSVFFSCFFLFLAVCVVIWKAKQADDLRRARQRHVVEMFNMAQRPYSSVMLDVSRELPTESQNSPKTRQKTKLANNYVPVALETTSDNIAAVCTVFIRLPETKQRRRPVCLGSTLISAPKQNIFLNKPQARIAQHNV
ncbi:hypothetical protein PVAND_016674 [Polypedilum vanderplanki]|uniref:Multiple epidermal growth factor-like domains protein 8 n=1 Tax=Polypedilum vanderplanki TaxID=319348 RepID=A0A9J6BGV1_POLVA|nr:hypothetical protein PVAND_016674 [Polypedilum vanderplanki]